MNMKKVGYLEAIVGCLLVVFMSDCQSPEKKRLNEYYAHHCIHVDSIYRHYFLQNDPDKYIQNICNAQSYLVQKGLTDSADKLLRYMQEYANTTKSDKYLNYHYLNYAYYHAGKGQVDSARIKFNWRNRYALDADVNNQLMAINFLGNLLYVEGKVDSARIEFTRGFDLSKEIGDTLQRFTLAVNAGATCDELGMFSAASYYFSEAYAISQRMKYPSLMMLNNLVVSLISEKKYDKAKKLCEQTMSLWLNSDKDRAAKLLQLNYTNLLSIFHHPEKMGAMLDGIDPKKLDAVYVPLYRSLQLDALLGLKKKEEFHQLIDTLQPYIYGNQPMTIIRMSSMLHKAIPMVGFPLQLDTLLRKYRSAEGQQWDLNARATYAELFAKVYESRGDVKNAMEWKGQWLNDKSRIAVINDSLRAADIGVQIDNTILKNAVVQKQMELERKSGRNQLLQYGLIISLILATTALLSLWLYRKNGRRKVAIMELESKLANQELEILKRDKEMKENVVAISQSVLEQIALIVQKIRTANFAKDPEAVVIRQDLVRLTQLSQTFMEPNLSETVYENYEYLFHEIPALKVLSVSEKKIFILTVLGNKPKDISALLNLNDQYIRNVKSKIKKLLPESLQEVAWSDFRRTV
ncbi:MAG: hypothetical protein ACKOXR_03245 [Bacteroidota bacterium]